MKFNTKEEVESVHLLSETSLLETRTFFDVLLARVVMNYAEGLPTVIPNLGQISITYKGDNYVNEGKKALLDISFVPDDNLIKNIGQVEDGSKTDIEMKFFQKICNALDDILEET